MNDDETLEKLKRDIGALTPKGDEGKQTASERSALAKATKLGTDLFAGVGVGGVIGYFLDRAFDSSPLCLILFFFIGFAAGVRNILRNASQI
jgi:ATP synthase protein I